MVEYTLQLDSVFGSLADATRRDILRRVSGNELSVSEIAEPYDVSLAAISKHLKILENAQLIRKRRQGKQHFVRVAPAAFQEATEYLRYYETFLNQRFDALQAYVEEENT